MAEINFEIDGSNNFLRMAEYGMHLGNALQEFADDFQLAEVVNVTFEDRINPNPNVPVPNKIEVLEGGRIINITYITMRFFLQGGGVDRPNELTFFQGLRYYMENTVIAEDNERFAAFNGNNEE
jgi:hypothetical protein